LGRFLEPPQWTLDSLRGRLRCHPLGGAIPPDGSQRPGTYLRT